MTVEIFGYGLHCLQSSYFGFVSQLLDILHGERSPEICSIVGSRLQMRDGNISMQEKRIDELVQKIERMQTQMEQDYAMLSDRVETTSNADSMTHDYATGLHYSLVEHGGFLGNGCGLRQAQWIHLTTLERTNLISARTLGSVEYMRLVRQRFTPQSISEETDDGPFEGAESEAMEHDGIIESPAGANSVTNIVEFLKSEHLQCLETWWHLGCQFGAKHNSWFPG